MVLHNGNFDEVFCTFVPSSYSNFFFLIFFFWHDSDYFSSSFNRFSEIDNSVSDLFHLLKNHGSEDDCNVFLILFWCSNYNYSSFSLNLFCSSFDRTFCNCSSKWVCNNDEIFIYNLALELTIPTFPS